MTDEPAAAIWAKMALARQFELSVVAASKAGVLPPAPFYLSIGQEHVPATASVVCEDWNVFPQHRGHSWYLSFGGDPLALIEELLGRPSGCAGGMGGSASLHWPPARIFGHSGLLGDQVPIAAGMALASGRNTVVVLGDAAVEEDYVLASFGFAATKKVPILFLVEDNNLSILTDKKTRRSWSATAVACGFGLGIDSVSYDGLRPLATVNRLYKSLCGSVNSLPALVNVKVCRRYWHAGHGQDQIGEPDLYEEWKKLMGEPALAHERDAAAKIRSLWDGAVGAGRISW